MTDPTVEDLEILMVSKHRTQIDVVMDSTPAWTLVSTVYVNDQAVSLAVVAVNQISQVNHAIRGDNILNFTGLHILTDDGGSFLIPCDRNTGSQIVALLQRMYVDDPTLEVRDRWTFTTPDDWSIPELRHQHPTPPEHESEPE